MMRENVCVNSEPRQKCVYKNEIVSNNLRLHPIDLFL